MRYVDQFSAKRVKLNVLECANCTAAPVCVGEGWIHQDFPELWWCENCVEDAPEGAARAEIK